MLNPQVVLPLLVAVGTPIAILYRWFGHRERMAALAAERAHPPADAERLARLEQAVEAIAVEIERVGEGQRYLTRVLADRPLPASAAPPARLKTNTPH